MANPARLLFLSKFLILCCAVFLAAPAMAVVEDYDDNLPFLRDEVVVETVAGDRYNFNVEVAAKTAQHEQGLMYRTHLPRFEGMLFAFETIRKRSFWMKDTLIPLDILFLAEDGTIHHIHHNARPQDKTNITSRDPVKAVLEINGGLSGELGIKEGDRVLHPIFRNVLAR